MTCPKILIFQERIKVLLGFPVFSCQPDFEALLPVKINQSNFQILRCQVIGDQGKVCHVHRTGVYVRTVHFRMLRCQIALQLGHAGQDDPVAILDQSGLQSFAIH
ncbi:hypothetical protein SDC9_159346 [bioreactor metagenome]|uniref:Uncharacterized protein n=1 Tax=bioreactor metagenome TaxID=1076179 RepID=A0A645FEL1_9ZZZZ